MISVDCQAWESCRLEAGTEARQPEAGSPEPLGVTTVGSGVSRDGGAGAEARPGAPGQEDEWRVDHRSVEEASRGSGEVASTRGGVWRWEEERIS